MAWVFTHDGRADLVVAPADEYPHAGEVGAWSVQYACGQDASDSSFQNVPGANGIGPVNGVLGTLSKGLLTSLAPSAPGLLDILAPALEGPRGPDTARSLDAWIALVDGAMTLAAGAAARGVGRELGHYRATTVVGSAARPRTAVRGIGPSRTTTRWTRRS